MSKVRIYDGPLLLLAMLATALGLVFIFDAGYARSLQQGAGPIPREFRTQLLFLPMAVGLGLWISRVRPETWRRYSKLLWLFTLIALIAPNVPGLGIEHNGATRWIGFGPFEIQPAEFAKLLVVIYLAGAFAGRPRWPVKVRRFKSRAAYVDSVVVPKAKRMLPALWVLIGVVMIELEPDLGTAAVVGATAFAMCIAGGVSRKTLLWGLAIGALGCTFLATQKAYRLERILTHGARVPARAGRDGDGQWGRGWRGDRRGPGQARAAGGDHRLRDRDGVRGVWPDRGAGLDRGDGGVGVAHAHPRTARALGVRGTAARGRGVLDRHPDMCECHDGERLAAGDRHPVAVHQFRRLKSGGSMDGGRSVSGGVGAASGEGGGG